MQPLVDVKLTVTDQGADLVLEGGDLAPERGLRSACFISLFTDVRAPDEASTPDSSRGGWWADEFGGPWGSRLWLDRASKAIPATRQRIAVSSEEALRWLVEDGIAESVQVEAELVDRQVQLELSLRRGSARRWSTLWEAEQGQGPSGTIDLVLQM